MKRRKFLTSSSTLAAASAVAATASAQPPQGERRVAVIGHTGRGDYGHGLDTVWTRLAGTKIVGVADANEKGLERELKKLDVDCGFNDYRKMLKETRPEFVSVCPRHPDQHLEMSMAAIEAGVKGLYVEKPFCRTPAEADTLIAACHQHGAKIAVAHRNRYHPVLQQIDGLIQEGALGKLLQIRGRGKGDHRGGGEDLWVLGSHVLNLIHYFAGRPKSCSAIMLQDGHHVTADDVKPGAEGLGPLAANAVHARYETEKGIVAYYDSISDDGTRGQAYCMELIGSDASLILHIDRTPLAHWIQGNPHQPPSKPRPWVPVTSAGVGAAEKQPEVISQVYNHVRGVRDLMDACDNDREPLCDVHDAALNIEMICSVFESHRQGGRAVRFPLTERQNALASL